MDVVVKAGGEVKVDAVEAPEAWADAVVFDNNEPAYGHTGGNSVHDNAHNGAHDSAHGNDGAEAAWGVCAVKTPMLCTKALRTTAIMSSYSW